MSSASGPPHRIISDLRSPKLTGSGAPTGPSTPPRNLSSAFGSPSTIRAEEDVVILEIGSRYLRAGFAGDAAPKAVVNFGPEEQRRAGDHRRWEVGYEKTWRNRMHGKTWGQSYELWRPDLRGLDLGLVGDKIDRAVREVFTKNLLVDSRPRRMTLVLPPSFPLPLLSAVLDTLFTSFQSPSISLLSAPMLSCVAAGVRSGLVIDIGWAETVVTGIYEFREMHCSRSIRATKVLGEAMFKTLSDAVDEARSEFHDGKSAYPSFEETEEIMARMAWCKPATKPEALSSPNQGLAPVSEEDELRASMRSMDLGDSSGDDSKVSIPLDSTNPPRTLRLPFSELAVPCESALFADGTPEQDLDDEELPLHLLVFRSLLQLPVDIRSVCMSRLIFVGGGARIPGLKQRIIDEVAKLVEHHGWTSVRGRAVSQYKNNPSLKSSRLRQDGPTDFRERSTSIGQIPTDLREQEYCPIDSAVQRESSKGAPPTESGYLRAVGSLGAWSGASLLSQLKIAAVSNIDKDQWLQYGAEGASRHGEVETTTSSKSRQSMGPGAALRAAERSSWTLGLWG